MLALLQEVVDLISLRCMAASKFLADSHALHQCLACVMVHVCQAPLHPFCQAVPAVSNSQIGKNLLYKPSTRTLTDWQKPFLNTQHQDPAW